MDLNDELAFQAREAGVMLTISTDSHAENNFFYMELGVAVARRAWCEPDNVLNTKRWKEIERFKLVKRKKI
jgi:DNA polymerase (family 10)